MDNFNIGEARKVFDVECYDPRNIVGFHRGDKPRIVRLNASDRMNVELKFEDFTALSREQEIR